jgi:hypothetical protein
MAMRRMKVAAIARTGTMHSEMAAPIGKLPAALVARATPRLGIDHRRHRLRPRDERPTGSRTAEKGNKLAAPHRFNSVLVRA